MAKPHRTINHVIDDLNSINRCLTVFYSRQGKRMAEDTAYTMSDSAREYSQQLEAKAKRLRSQVIRLHKKAA